MVNHIKISDIDATDRLRPVDRDYSELLRNSIEETGLQNPIIVRPAPEGSVFKYILVAGAHRLDALVAAQWRELTVGEHVKIEEMGDDEARLAEIDENLARHELNALDRALFLAERKRLYEALRGETKRGGDRRSKARIKSQTLAFDPFSRAAAKKLGLSEAAIKLSVKLASDLDPEAIKLLRGTKIERNQRELLALAALHPDVQCEAAEMIRDGKVKTTLQAKWALDIEAKPKSEPGDVAAAHIIALWPKMNAVQVAHVFQTLGLAYSKGGKK